MGKSAINILKAYWQRYWHVFWAEFKWNPKHRTYTEGIETRIVYRKLNFPIWFNPMVISCTCGKCFYKKS